jgi:Na+/melibiose symporter-like transporter
VALGSFTLSASIFAMFLYLTLYLQVVLGLSPFQAGLRFLPLTMLAFVVAPVAGKLTVRVQSRFLMSLGLLLVAIGCFLMTHVQADSSWLVLLPGFLVAGVGIGITNPTLASGAVSVVPPQQSGMSSGAASTFRQVGIATGIAGLGAIFTSQILSRTIAVLETTPAGRVVVSRGGSQLHQAITGGGVRQAVAHIPLPAARTALVDAYRAGFASTFNHLMGIASVVALTGAIGAFFLVRQKDFVISHGPGEGPRGEATEGETAAAHGG